MSPIAAVSVVRLSRLTDASTSPERQREVNTGWCHQHGATLAGEALDLDVSGSVSPFEREGLGPWLTDDPPEPWTVMVAWRLDRVSRSALDTLQLLEWLQERGKRLVTVDDGIDTGTSMGRLFVQIAGIFAQLERETIKERTLASRAALRAAGRYGGEQVQYGHKAVPLDGGGYRLDLDPVAAEGVKFAAREVLAGASVAATARKLQEAGYAAPRDRQRQLRGQPTKGDKWSDTTLRKLLQSKSLLGWTVHNGEADPDNPKAPAVLTAGEFQRLQDELTSRSRKKERNRRSDSSPLSGLAVCWVITEHEPECHGDASRADCLCSPCLEPLWHRAQHDRKSGKTYRYYYCKHKGHTRQIRAEDLEYLCRALFLRMFANTEVVEPVHRPASDVSEELAAAQLAVEDLTQRLASARSASVRQALTEQLTALDEKLSELESVPDDPGGTEYVPTGTTWQEELDRRTPDEQRALMLRARFRFGITSYRDGRVSIGMSAPREVTGRFHQQLKADGYTVHTDDPEALEALEAL